MTVEQANTLKDLGNKAFSAGDYTAAVGHFTEAIKLDPSNHILFSNRSAAYCSLKDYTAALEDAEKCVKIKPDWGKGYGRKGAALHGAGFYSQAADAYEAGLKVDPNNAQLKSGLAEVREAEASEMNPNMMRNPFNDPNLIGRIATNPKTASYLNDPAFVEKLKQVSRSSTLSQEVLQDPRLIQVLGVLMGANFDMSEGDEMDTTPQEPAAATKQTHEPHAKKEEPPAPAEPEDEISEEEKEEKARKAEAEREKTLGNETYKKREFTKALEHYTKAWELDQNITYLTNRAAVHFEMGNFDDCIKDCEDAINRGRELHADYKIIAKAYGRMGSASQKKGDLDSSIKYFEKSLTEHRTPEILNKLREVEKLKEKHDREAYINPELAEKAREAGNELFKSGDFSGAIKQYTEAIKRNPSDPRAYNNRAACFNKLMSLNEAFKDVEQALSLDPKFVKAHIRKAHILASRKDYLKAIEAVEVAREHDIDGKNAAEISQIEQKATYALQTQFQDETEEQRGARIARDPEIQQILGDPVMQTILQQISQDPKALLDHMQNPIVRSKIQKLMAAGVIRTR